MRVSPKPTLPQRYIAFVDNILDESVEVFVSLQGLEAIQMVISSLKDPLESASKVKRVSFMLTLR